MFAPVNLKKRKVEKTDKTRKNTIVRVLQPHSTLEKWLVEWADLSRSWENKNTIGLLLKGDGCPSYIN